MQRVAAGQEIKLVVDAFAGGDVVTGPIEPENVTVVVAGHGQGTHLSARDPEDANEDNPKASEDYDESIKYEKLNGSQPRELSARIAFAKNITKALFGTGSGLNRVDVCGGGTLPSNEKFRDTNPAAALADALREQVRGYYGSVAFNYLGWRMPSGPAVDIKPK